MKKLLIIAAALGALALAGCKPNQEAYSEAYRRAVAQRDSVNGLQGTIYDHYREMARRRVIRAGDDSIAVTTEFVGLTKEKGVTPVAMQRYNVVVAQFKQIFNARQMRDRLALLGYPEPFIVQTREPLYYVVAFTEPTVTGIIGKLRAVEADSNLLMRPPLPFVLLPAQMAR